MSRKTAASPRRHSESGRTVGRHRVVRVIAEGDGRDTVLEARTANGARVALTVIGEPLASDTERLRTVVRLLRVRAALQHPALVPLRGPFQHDRRIYYTMPFPDRTLAARLSGGVLAPAEAVRLLAPVAAALEVAAAKGVFHRGLTPKTISLDGGRQEPARLTDFAITRAAAPACAAPDGLDGVEYRCPEELRGEASRLRGSVYSLGCILMECVTGAPPFRHPRPLLTLHAHEVEPVPRVTERVPGLPAALDEVLARALAKDPRERYRSPTELVDAASRALGLGRRASAGEDLERQRTRDRVAAREQRRRRRREERRPARSGHISRPSRTSRRRVLTVVPIGAALLVSAMGGFATGSSGSDAPPRHAAAAPGMAPAAVPPAARKRAAYVRRVDRTVARLDTRRTAARHRLRAARTPARQRAAARSLAAAYRDARVALPRTPAGVHSPAPRLHDAQRAYAGLAVAARSGNRRAWARAGRRVSRNEARLHRALRSLGGPGAG
jgi:Protein kinase domain